MLSLPKPGHITTGQYASTLLLPVFEAKISNDNNNTAIGRMVKYCFVSRRLLLVFLWHREVIVAITSKVVFSSILQGTSEVGSRSKQKNMLLDLYK